MKRYLLAGILTVMAMRVCALPNLIGRWQTAPIWDRFKQTVVEITFKDTVHIEAKAIIDNSYFTDEEPTTLSMSGTYLLQDSLCILTADTATYLGVDNQEEYVILPSKKSDDVIALIDAKTAHSVFVFCRQKE